MADLKQTIDEVLNGVPLIRLQSGREMSLASTNRRMNRSPKDWRYYVAMPDGSAIVEMSYQTAQELADSFAEIAHEIEYHHSQGIRQQTEYHGLSSDGVEL